MNNAIHRATKAYNEKEEKLAKKEKREAVILPNFSAHNLRYPNLYKIQTFLVKFLIILN